MDESKIKFGDKIFLYGQFMNQERWDEYGFANPVYNSVLGYIPVGGYLVSPQKTDMLTACVPGFVVDFLQGASLAFLTPFPEKDLIDVTDSLSLQSPYIQGSRVWMPTGS
jgi:hypothetical protein